MEGKKVVKKIIRRIVYGKPAEEDRLIAFATAFPRHKKHSFTYRNYSLIVTDLLSVAWQIKEYFGDERLRFLSEKKAPVIIDCGSNIGISALYFKSLFPSAKITCFEPDPVVFECLQANLKNNGALDVVCEKKVIWINDNGVEFGLEGADGGSVLQTKNAEKLPSVRLADVLRSYDAIDLLKIDIEGAETEVLRDCASELKRVKFLYVEYHSLRNRKQELDVLLKILKEQGFRYYIQRIGAYHSKPFEKLEPGDMDVQLDIHAIRE